MLLKNKFKDTDSSLVLIPHGNYNKISIMFESNDWNADEARNFIEKYYFHNCHFSANFDVNIFFQDYLKDFKVDEVLKDFYSEKVKSTFELEFSHADTIIKKSTIQQKNVKFHNFEQPVMFNNQRNQCTENLVPGIFHKNKATEVNSHFVSKAVDGSVLKMADVSNKCDNILKRKKNVAFFESANETTTTKKICISSTKENLHHTYQSQQSLTRTKDMNKNQNSVCNSKKQFLLDLFKLPNKRSIRALRTKCTVIRKFPGPAGLLPDNVNESEIIDLDSTDKNKQNKVDNFTDVYSQNTKNIFTAGAWQLMIDDLPVDFQLYEIAVVKENALAFSRSYKKVPFLAGIIQYIDYKPNDPHVLLKDFSGKIDACIHHSICKLYPNALGTNVVILLKDVGLIVTSKNYVCAIISPKNLISIYSDNARLVETPHFEELVDYNCNLNHGNKKVKSKLLQKKKNEHSSNYILNTNEVYDREEQIPMNICGNNYTDIEKDSYVINHVLDIDFNQDDSWLGVHIDDLNSFGSDKFASSTPVFMKNNSSDNKIVSKILHNFEQKEKPKSMLLRPCSDEKTSNNSLSNVSNKSDYSKLSEISMLEKGNINNIKNKVLNCDQNDIDDEILSQIDVDAIAANYDK